MNLTELFSESKRQLDHDSDASSLKTAVLWGREDLLGKAIESILEATHNWQVIKILGNRDDRLLAREMKKVNPKIIIINQGDCADELPIPIQLIQDFPELKIITVNSENNLMEVYNRQKFWIREATDLLSIIDEQPNYSAKGDEKPATENDRYTHSPVTQTGKNQ